MVSTLKTFYQKEVYESSICQMIINIINCAHEGACVITFLYPIVVAVLEGSSFTVSAKKYPQILANPLLP